MADNAQNVEGSAGTPTKRKGGKKIVLLIAISIFLALPVLSLAVGIGIIPQGGTFAGITGSLPTSTGNVTTGADCTSVLMDKSTAYVPGLVGHTGTEGGKNDMNAQRVHTIEDYLAGKYQNLHKGDEFFNTLLPDSNYVSLASDVSKGPGRTYVYGQKAVIPTIEQKNGNKEIVFRLTDTGSAFNQPRAELHIDIATNNPARANDAGPLGLTNFTMRVGEGCKHNAAGAS